jgi:hypothetical protein
MPGQHFFHGRDFAAGKARSAGYALAGMPGRVSNPGPGWFLRRKLLPEIRDKLGKLLDIPGTGVKMKGPRSTPGRYFQAAYSRDIPRSSAVRPNRYRKTAISGRGW